jgi:hypothetical protein
MTVAQAANPITDVPSEVRAQWIQHQTFEISAFITPDTELIFAASCVTGNRLSLVLCVAFVRELFNVYSSESRNYVISQVANQGPRRARLWRNRFVGTETPTH